MPQSDFTNIKIILVGYYKQLYGNKFDNLNEMHKSLEIHKLPSHIEEKIVNII